MHLPDWMIVVGPETTSHIVASDTRIAVIILESVPLRMIQNIREEAMCIIDDALGPLMRGCKVVDISRKQVIIEQRDTFGIIINDLLSILGNHGSTLQRRHIDEEKVACAGVVQAIHQDEVLVHSWS